MMASKANSINETLLDILRIPSVTKSEKVICDHVEEFISEKFKGAKEQIEVQRINNSLIIWGQNIANRETLALAGHLDTVPPAEGANEVALNGDKIVGVGASDMKGGVAVMLELLSPEVIKSSPYNLVFIFYEAEEGNYVENGIHQVIEQVVAAPHKIDLCFVLEPTDNTLHLGCLGSLNVKVTFKGRRAHAARPWEGENSIYKALPLLNKLASLERKKITVAGLDYFEVISPTIAQAGQAKNVVPEIFEINLNARFAPGTSVAAAKENILRLVDGAGVVEFVDVSPSCPIPENNSILQRFRQKLGLPENPKQAYTDVAVFAQNGIAAVNCGPGHTAQAHQRGEYITTAALKRGLEIYESFLLAK